MVQLDLPTPPPVVVDGLRDPTHDVHYWGLATFGWDGKWRCYANVSGFLCLVEVTIKNLDR
jgi:hypothetical protein